MCEIQHGKKTLDEEWMRGAIHQARLREKEGYRYRLHIHHHGTGRTTEPAGFFTPSGVRDYVYEGEVRRTLFVNYQDVPDAVYQRMRAGELPHRSIECLDVTRDVPELDSLSLLDTPTPKFRFKVTTGDTLIEEPLAASDDDPGGQPPELVAESGPVDLWQSGERVAALFKEVTHPMKASLRFSENGLVLVGEDGAEIKETLTFSVNGTECEIVGVEMPKADDSKLLAAEERIEQLETKLAEAPADVDSVAQFAEMRARLDTLEAKDRKSELLASAHKTLKDQGFAISEEVEADLAKYADQGEEVLNQYVESYAKFAAPEPPSFDGVVGKKVVSDNPVVAKFVAELPERADEIRDASIEYEQAQRALGLKCSEENFIADRLGV